MIRLAAAQDVPALKQIWKQCFGDPDDYITFYFSKGFQPQYTYVYTEQSRPAAMLAMLPAALFAGGAAHRMGYIYAAATLPRMQGQGIMAKMLEYAADIALGMGLCGLALVPGSEGLFEYYRRNHFTTRFYHQTGTLAYSPENAAREPALSFVDAAAYRASREKLRGGYAFLALTEPFDEYVGAELAYMGYRFLQGEAFSAAVYDSGDFITVRELICDASAQKSAVEAIMAYFRKGALVRLAADSTLDGLTRAPYAMVRWVGGFDAPNGVCYANLMLD